MNNKLSVIYVDHSEDFSGGQKSLLTLLAKLDIKKITPVVLIDKKAKLMARELSKLEIRTLQINFWNLPFLEYPMILIPIVKVLWFNKTLGIHLIHCNTFKAGCIGAICSFLTSTPIIFRARLGITYLSHGLIDRIIHQRSRLILANSHYVKETFSRRFGLNNKVVVVYNPVDFESQCDTSIIAELKAKYFSKGHSTYFGVIGRIEPFKRLHEVVEATRELRSRKRINVRILFIGSTPLALGDSYKAELTDLISKYQLSEQIVFTGFLTHIKEVCSLLDCVILSSQGEALSRGVYESQALGLPVIASSSGGNTELIEDGINGILYEPGNVQSLARAMEQIADDQELRVTMGKKAYLKVREVFDDTNTVCKEVNCYYQLL